MTGRPRQQGLEAGHAVSAVKEPNLGMVLSTVSDNLRVTQLVRGQVGNEVGTVIASQSISRALSYP